MYKKLKTMPLFFTDILLRRIIFKIENIEREREIK